MKPEVGKVYEIPFPFHLVDTWVGYGDAPEQGWKPGAFYEEGDIEAGIPSGYKFDEWGTMVLEVLDKHRVPGFRERCFYVVTWITPDGVWIGKRSLQCRPTGVVTRMFNGNFHIPKPEGFQVQVRDAVGGKP